MASGKQNRDFESSILSELNLLDNAIQWIQGNMKVDDVFDEKDIQNHVEDGDPEDYFSTKRLEQWAEENGFVKET